MKPQPRTLTTAAILLSTTLTLTACGNNNDSSPNDKDKIAGADNSDKPETPSPSPTPTDNPAKRPTLKIPNTFKMHFPGWTSNDPKKQAVLNDGKERMRAVNEAILQEPPNPESKNVAFYHAEGSVDATKDWVRGFKENKLTIVGTVTYNDPKVTFSTEGAATLSYCADESKATSTPVGEKNPDMNSGTGKPVFYNSMLRKNKNGIWQTVRLSTERGAC